MRLVSGALSWNSHTITSPNWFDSRLCLSWLRPALWLWSVSGNQRALGREGREEMLEQPLSEKEKRVVFRALRKTSNKSSLARSVDVRVVGPLGQAASHIASHMVCIYPHSCRPSSNCQVMYRCSGPSSLQSLLFLLFINGGTVVCWSWWWRW